MDIAHPDPAPRAASLMTALHLKNRDIPNAEMWLMELIGWLSFDAKDFRENREAHGARVLVVDDYPDAAETGCVLLGYLGHEATAAHTGKGALSALEMFDYDVVILDIGLPDISGLEVAKQLRRRQNCPYIIAVSGWATPHDQTRAINAGCHEFLPKPFDFAKLKHALTCASQGVDRGLTRATSR